MTYIKYAFRREKKIIITVYIEYQLLIMYRVVSQSFVNNLDREPQNDMLKVKQNLDRLVTKEETLDFASIQSASSSIYGYQGGSQSTGSGSFVNLNGDLTKGYFLTAAHCVMKLNEYALMDSLYITNPITNKWFSVTMTDVFIDGLADIALIQTNIDFTAHPHFCLPFSTVEAKTGDVCFVCGNPGGIDNDSVTRGIVRDGHFTLTSGSYVPDAIHIDSPGISGNSGSPIMNKNGQIIGLFTFGFNLENFNGGPNLNTLRESLKVLITRQDYKSKKYLGFDWVVYGPNVFKYYHGSDSEFPNQGVIIRNMDTNSPFHNTSITNNDLILSFTINGKKMEVGVLPHQRTLGLLVYSTSDTTTVEYIKYEYPNQDPTVRKETISLNVTYENVDSRHDLVLEGGTN